MTQSLLNRKFFFDRVRAALFDGRLSAAQVAGMGGLLDEWERTSARSDDRWLAYMLATAHHETDRKMQPIKEYGGAAYFRKMYDVYGARPALARQNGNTEAGDGARYFGRGFVQLTWKNNYRAMSKVTGVDLVADPDQALDLAVATKIMFHGMARGTFTGRKLGDYLSPAKEDWVNARRVINGLDKANLVASHAKNYYGALSYTTG